LYTHAVLFEYSERIVVKFNIMDTDAGYYKTTSLLYSFLSGTSYVNVSDISGVDAGDNSYITLGPSTDPSNIGATESIRITGVNIPNKKVWLSRDTTYAYLATDQARFYTSEGNAFAYEYYFDCVPDWRKPYVANVAPANLETGVDTLPTISFDLYDVGEGVDIYSLLMLVDGKKVTPSITVIPNGYHVSYTPTVEFPHNYKINVSVEVSDISAQQNKLTYIWSFTTELSVAPVYTNFDPDMCSFNVSSVTDFEFDVFGLDDGIDSTSILMRVGDEDVSFTLTPRLYRII
jgi:hypothetical protein